LVFSSNINGIGWGALTQREDHKLINTDKEKTMLTPASDAFIQLAAKCVEHRVTVDLFFAMN
jgi:hypothetical protein